MLGISVGGIAIKLTYDTTPLVASFTAGGIWPFQDPAWFGPLWQTNIQRFAKRRGGADLSVPFSSASFTRGSGSFRTASAAGFDNCFGTGGGGSSAYIATAAPGFFPVFTGAGNEATVRDARELTSEIYDAQGRLATLRRARGDGVDLQYSPQEVLSIVNGVEGRSVSIESEQDSERGVYRITKMTGSDGAVVQFTYLPSGMLKTIQWVGSGTVEFLYEDLRHPELLTGIVDESGKRYGTYSYDDMGRALTTSLGQGIDQFAVSYGNPPRALWSERQFDYFICREMTWQSPTDTVVTKPLGQTITLQAATVAGDVARTSVSVPAGSGSSMSVATYAYDSLGNRIVADDAAGNRSCYVYDESRNLLKASLAGLPSTKPCPADLSNYLPSPADQRHPERRASYLWHPDWALRTRSAEPKRIQTSVYNGQPDPVVGGTPICAPDAPSLPDGSKIAVLCRRYEQATTDVSGTLGFDAQLDPAVPTRKWSYTYNARGQMLTETGPANASGASQGGTTQYVYYETTSTDADFAAGAGHTIGDLQTVTNAMNQSVQYLAYDRAGRLLKSRDANGLVTTQTWWPRGWLHTRTLTTAGGASMTTTYDYWPTGLLHTVTMPDGAVLTYDYDDAHRLTDVTDASGNKVHYDLDAEGNRRGETVKDASGTLVKTIARVFDDLGRLQSVTGSMQ